MTNNIIVTMKENVLTVVTPITKTAYEKAMSDMVVKDEKKENTLFRVVVDKNGAAAIGENFLQCNTYVDEKLAVQMVFKMGTKMEDVKALYGKALLNANQYIPQILTNITAETAAVDAIFGETAE